MNEYKIKHNTEKVKKFYKKTIINKITLIQV